MDRAEERAGPEDVGDQALMRGLDTALPFVRPDDGVAASAQNLTSAREQRGCAIAG